MGNKKAHVTVRGQDPPSSALMTELEGGPPVAVPIEPILQPGQQQPLSSSSSSKKKKIPWMEERETTTTTTRLSPKSRASTMGTMHQRKPIEVSFGSPTSSSSNNYSMGSHETTAAVLAVHEKARRQRIAKIAVHASKIHRPWSKWNLPQILCLGLGAIIGLWGFLGTWMAMEMVHHQQQPAGVVKFRRRSSMAPAYKDLTARDQVSLTLVTQVSHDRLWMLKHHCERYRSENNHHQHPMSIAVYSNQTLEEISNELIEHGCTLAAEDHPTTKERTGIILSVLDALHYGSWNDYPVNELRNLALSKVTTTHIFYLDVDFWPSEGLYETLVSETITDALVRDPKQAIVVPAFQLWRQCKEWKDCREKNLFKMEASKTVKGLVKEVMDHKSVTVFDPTNKGGHGSTNYPLWFHQSRGSLEAIDCLGSNRYEPFVVVRYSRNLPPFQEVFSGYGKNKVTWTMQLVAEGYVFGQVGGGFVVHYPHLDSSSRQHWNQGSQKDAKAKRSQVDALFVDFKTWLSTTIPKSQTRMSLCPDAQDDDWKLWIDHKNNHNNNENNNNNA